MSAVLVTVLNGRTVLDSGTGIVLHHESKVTAGTTTETTYVLTCGHTLRALGRRAADSQDNPIRIQVGGRPAKDIGDPALACRDLAVLAAEGRVGERDTVQSPGDLKGVRCDGFARFFETQFALRQVAGEVKESVVTHTPDGLVVEYLKIAARSGSASFERGLSGGPVYASTVVVKTRSKRGSRRPAPSDAPSDAPAPVVGVSRILENTTDGRVAYAIALTPDILALIQQHVPYPLTGGQRGDHPPLPEADSEDPDDVQKGRWGGANHSPDGYELTIENVEKYSRFFTFDAVLKDNAGKRLVPPFVFHLHDTYAKSVIWIRRTDGKRAVLEQVSASGTYTFGVQFKDPSGAWRSLEYDLSTDNSLNLAEYD